MANETTSTTLEEIVNSEFIEPTFMDYERERLVVAQYLRRFDLRGRGSATVAVPRMVGDMGTPGDAGAGVDTEYDATEATDLSNVQLDLAESTITSGEYGILRTITDTALEDVVSGFELIQEIGVNAAEILATALEDDICALFSGFSSSVGSTGVDLTLQNMRDAIVTIRNAGIRAPDGLVFVLDMQAASDYEAAIVSTNAAAAVYASAADRADRAAPDANNGLTEGLAGFFRGYRVHYTGLTDTANAGADVSSACFVRGDTPANARTAALGMTVSREFTIATERDESLRATEIVATQRMGVGELLDSAGVHIVSDA